MSETTELTKGLIGAEDLLGSQSSAVVSQNRLDDTGEEVAYDITPINTASIFCSAAAVTAFSLSANAKLDAALSAALVVNATTAVAGKTRLSDAPTNAAIPIAVGTNSAAYQRILSAAITAACTGSAQTPDYGNPFVTTYQMQLALSLNLGSGKDGHGQLGAIAASSTAPASLDVTASGLLTGTYTYKIAAYNLSGAIVASSASASTGAITAKQVTMTLPALPTNAMGWRVYRSSDGINWYYVGAAVLGYNYTETASDARQYRYTDNVPYPNTSVSAPGSDTTGASATLSGLFQFITFTLGAAQTINVATSGSTAGILDIRVQGTFTPNATATISNVGTNRIGVGRFALSLGSNHTQSVTTGQTALMALPADLTFSTATPYYKTAATTFLAPIGFGADIGMSDKLWSGFGTKGNVYGTLAGGAGGWGGGLTRIWCYQIANGDLVGTFNATGQAGTAGTGTASQGGGGGGGGINDIGAVVPWRNSATVNAAGGAGGAASGSGGANTITGAPGGGGGLNLFRNCFDTSGATLSVAAGANGANATNAAAAATEYVFSGGHYGNGGRATANTAVTSGTAGQSITLNGFYDPSPVFVA